MVPVKYLRVISLDPNLSSVALQMADIWINHLAPFSLTIHPAAPLSKILLCLAIQEVIWTL